MADPQSSSTTPPPPPPLVRSSSDMLYYGLVVVATAVIVLVLYNIVIVRWCADQRPPQRVRHRLPRQAATWRITDSPAISVASFMYEGGEKGKDGGGDSECAVCLSVFELGEEIKQLPNCKHYFHAPCIDMWLYSHMDCPLCRSPVEPSPLHRPVAAVEETEHSREVLLGPGSLV